MPKIKPIPNSYMLAHRFRKRNGQWSDWNNAIGQWQGIEIVRNQIAILKRSRPNREMEFSIKYEGKYLDLAGNQIEGSFKLDTK